jgi:hypothetical protein
VPVNPERSRHRVSINLPRNGLQADNTCALCDQNLEYVSHLLLGCVYSREVWASFLQSCGWEQLISMADSSFVDWWLASHKLITKQRRKAFDSIVILVSRCIWLQQNSHVFDRQSTPPLALVHVVKSQCEPIFLLT